MDEQPTKIRNTGTLLDKLKRSYRQFLDNPVCPAHHSHFFLLKNSSITTATVIITPQKTK